MLKQIIIITILLAAISIYANQEESFEFGKRMYRDGFHQEAILVLERITNTAPQSEEAEESLFLLGDIHSEINNHDQAERYYQRFYERYPRSSRREDALYHWALSLYKQDKYSQALDLFSSFLESYPDSAKKSDTFFYLISSYYNINNYQSSLAKSREFVELFSTDIRIPDVMYMMAVSYLKTSRRNDADNTMNIIIRDYPQSNARWEAIITQGILLKEERSIQSALEHFNNQLDHQIPRQYEERILNHIAGLYVSTEHYQKAAQTLDMLIGKFDRSPRLSEYLHLRALSLNRQGNYQSVIDHYVGLDLREITDTSHYYDYLLKVARSYFILHQFDQTENIIKDIAYKVERDDHVYQVLYWQARLKEQQGNLLQAVNSYQYLLTNYPFLADNEELLMKIGDIYFEKMHMYQTAISYYEQVITSVNLSGDYYREAVFKKALCHEILGEYNAALNSLRQINVDQIENENERKQILNRIEIISQFKNVNHQKISADLISALYKYVEKDDKEYLREELIRTMLIEMKDVEGVLSLLEHDQTAKGNYLRGRAYLMALSRAELESRLSDKRRLMESVNTQISILDRTVQPAYTAELEIERDFITNGFRLTPDNLSKAENFIAQYPLASAVNRFRFLIGRQYLDNDVYGMADQYLSNVINDSEISTVQYERAMLKMANHYFAEGRYERVITFFDQIETGLTISRPEELFRYAVSLKRTGEIEQGMRELEFLVKNTSDFPERDVAINLVADYYRDRDNYREAISYMLLYPESKRDRDYYLRLSDDYREINDPGKAKESLMYITDKDREVLLKLADLHYQTGDMIMAELTYTGLIDDLQDRSDRLLAETKLAHIYFVQEKWRDALTLYQAVTSELGESIDVLQYDYLDLVQIGKEKIITLYRVQNRPRADTIRQRFQSILRSDERALVEIDLNEAIYQMNINRNRAERDFSSIISQSDLPESLRMQAYFWRGVNRLEVQRVNDAESDFRQVLNATDRHLVNQAHLKLGTISFSKEQYQQALEHYHQVIEYDTTGRLAYDAAMNYGIVCKTIGEWQQAIEAYRILLSHSNNNSERGKAYFNIGYCQFRDRQYIEALQSLEQAIPLLTDREIKAEAQYWIGESYFSMNQYENAATEYLKVGYFYPEFTQWNAISELKLAQSYMQQGRTENARNILNSIIEKYGRGSDWGKQALVFLEQL